MQRVNYAIKLVVVERVPDLQHEEPRAVVTEEDVGGDKLVMKCSDNKKRRTHQPITRKDMDCHAG